MLRLTAPDSFIGGLLVSARYWHDAATLNIAVDRMRNDLKAFRGFL
jgi:hypothetical protein